MQAFQPISALEALLHFQNIAHEFVIFFGRPDFSFTGGLFDRAERLHHQDRVMGNNSAATFANDCWMRDPFRIAHLHNIPDHIVGVFLQRIVGRTIEGRSRAVVIYSQSATDIEILELVTEFCDLGIVTRRFTHRALDCRNVGDLRPGVKMDQFQAMRQALRLQHLAGCDQTNGIETKLGILTATGSPFAGAFAVQSHPDANQRLNPDFF